MGIDAYMTLDAAVERYGELFTRHQLMQATRARRLRFVQKGRRRFVTEAWLDEFMALDEHKPCPKNPNDQPDPKNPNDSSNSGDTGSTDMKTPPISTDVGMTTEQEELAADLLKRKILR